MTEDRSTRTSPDHPAGSARRLTTAAVGAGVGITAVVGLAVGAAGLAGAQDDPTIPDTTAASEDACPHEARLHRFESERGPGPGGVAAAELLGMTTDELRDALRSGSTLAELAEERGVAIEDLADAMLTGMEERLVERIENGHEARRGGLGRGERWEG